MNVIEFKDKVKKIRERIVTSDVWTSCFRHGYSDTDDHRKAMIDSNVFLHLHPAKVSRHAIKMSYTWGVGGLTFLFFLILVTTGILLMFYFRPVPEYAYVDIKSLQFSVPFGRLVRNLHYWSAHFMVIMAMLHLFRVFLTGSYKTPRQFNWVIGSFLLVMTFLMGLTGYLLSMDASAMAASSIVSSVGGAGFIGNPLFILKVYVWHCIVLPAFSVLLIVIHFWRVRKDGGISGPKAAQEMEEVHTWPHLVRIEFIVALLAVIVVLSLSLFADAPLISHAMRAPWYFLGLQEMLVCFDPWFVDIALPILILMGLIVIPYIDLNAKGNGYYTFTERPFAISIFVFAFLFSWIAMILIGAIQQGASSHPVVLWYEENIFWNRASTDVTLNVLMAQKLGLDFLRNEVVGAFLGTIIIGAYYSIAIPFYCIKKQSSEILQKLGVFRYAIASFLVLTMAGLVIKMLLFWIFNIKYIVQYPWININF